MSRVLPKVTLTPADAHVSAEYVQARAHNGHAIPGRIYLRIGDVALYMDPSTALAITAELERAFQCLERLECNARKGVDDVSCECHEGDEPGGEA